MKKIVLILSLCFFSKNSLSQELHVGEIPVCEKIQLIAKAAVDAKSEGISKEFMSTPLLSSKEIKRYAIKKKESSLM